MIDTINKQIYLERFLSPLRREATSDSQYAGRLISVYSRRVSYFLYYLFHLKVKWYNDEYVARKVALSEVNNPFSKALGNQLKNRGINVLTAKSLWRKIHSNPLTEKLYQEAENAFKKLGHPTVEIRLINQKKAPQQGPFMGFCSDHTGEILIRVEQTKKQALAVLIFELFNATTSQQFSKIGAKLRRGLSAEQYATEMEKIEHENSHKHRKLLSKLIKDYGWDPSLNIYINLGSFEKNLETQKACGHFQYYVKGAEEYKEYLVEFEKNRVQFEKDRVGHQTIYLPPSILNPPPES